MPRTDDRRRFRSVNFFQILGFPVSKRSSGEKMAVLRRPSGRPRDDRLSRLRRELAASREEVRRLQRQVADRDEAIRRSEPDPPPVCGYRNSHYGTCPFHGGRCPGASA